MFWNYEEWTNAFLIQFIAVILAFIVGKKSQVKDTDIIIAISLVSPVPPFTISDGVAGAILFSDLLAIYLFLRDRTRIRITILVALNFLLYVMWPIFSTLLSIIYSNFASHLVVFDQKIFAIQSLRYFFYFILFTKFTSKFYDSPAYLLKLFKVQSVILFFVFSAILLGYFGVAKVDAWNELSQIDLGVGNLGKGGMFLYRGGVGTLGTIVIPVIYFCYINGKGFYKYLMIFMIFIILMAILFSGSRQGISLSLLSLLLSLLLFKQYKSAIQFIVIVFFIVFGIMQNQFIRETSDWVLNRYEILLDANIDLNDEIKDRSFLVDDAKNQEKDIFYEINGFGLGSVIVSTESDYYNTYSYFGIVGSLIYYIFIFLTFLNIYKIWHRTINIANKNITLISLLIALILPMYGFQQWYIMTHSPSNSMNVFLILFLFSVGLAERKT